MKRILFVFAFLILTAVVVGPLMAQDNPFVGTWKLNLTKSKFEPGPAPKSQTRTVVADGSGAKYSFESVAADGTSRTYGFSTNYDGKDSPATGKGLPGDADSIAIKRVGPNKAEAVLKKGGKEVGTSSVEVSKDGKVTTIIGKGKNPDGKEYASVSVYDKQ
jgi:hypothetical protein